MKVRSPAATPYLRLVSTGLPERMIGPAPSGNICNSDDCFNSQQSTVKRRTPLKNITISTTLAASLLLLTAGFLLPTKASNSPFQLAQQPNCKSPQTTVDQNVCSSQEFQAADRKLNQVYQQLQPKLNSKQKQRLIVAQRSWLKFRDESCDYEAGYFEGGSVAPSIYGYCRARVTKERIKDFERYLEQVSL